MNLRPPSRSLVMDTNILLGFALGDRERARTILSRVLSSRSVIITADSRNEALKVAAEIEVRRPVRAVTAVELLLAPVAVADHSFYADLLGPAADCLRLAVPSRNGSTSDAHVLALAWATDSDIWSGDRDFAGTGWPSWSNANLYRALAEA